ncbi:MAG: LysR family transcriptional regulator [Burkholderiales bacterium]|jgi:DNA-binding transcriptional LysR family regulator|nr:LysR family transcriptional regulator [Burkholderiales bacterium]
MLDIELLRSFVSVAEFHSFTQAAKHLHIAQSTISQHIKRLEENIGHDLFSRTTRLTTLTETGEKLFSFAR